ncbi:zinc-binding dehydrogenase [Cypionkella sinensis]|uniref:Zinc-binding dehydrogenase n=1 Tax=Cypionkella sinensis TaxID=1756043 RepID=A0ABV7J2M1_9RHOB
MAQEIVISGKQSFSLASYQDAPLQQDEIRGRTMCTLISQGTELGWANGDSFPIRPGYAAVFEVQEIGADVVGVKPGDLRFAMGCHRSTQTHPVGQTLAVPAGLAPDRAVVARLLGVTISTLMTTRARPGDPMVITGAGPVGFLAAQLFQAFGYAVTVVDPDARRRAQVVASGIADCRAEMPLEDAALAGKVALVVDCSGHEGAVLAGCKMVRRLGEVVLVGVPWRKMTETSAHEVLSAVFFNLVTLRSGWEWQLPIKSKAFVWEELMEGYNNAPHSIMDGFRRALDWLTEGRFMLEGLFHIAEPGDPAALYGQIARREIVEPFIVLDWCDAEG